MHTFTIVVGSTDGNTLGQKARRDNDDHSRGWKDVFGYRHEDLREVG